MSNIEQILNKHSIKTFDDFESKIQTGDAELEQDLYEHFLNSGEMPYGTAKARTGDPSEFIYSAMENYLGG